MNSTPLKSLDTVTSSLLLENAAHIADLIQSWKAAGIYKYDVPQTQEKIEVGVRTKDHLNNDFWVARLNTFEELSPDGRKRLWEQLFKYSIGSTKDLQDCHTVHEQHYIEELYDFDISAYTLEDTPEGYESFSYLVETFYKLQWPLKRRRFSNLVHILKSTDERTAFVISIAVDPSLIPNATKDATLIDAQYTSVERLEYDGTNLLWLMTTCSDAKGNVPQWLARSSINSVVAKDVPNFLKWVGKTP
ncbi:hypothetical protein METBIDRAFT_10169 [Metschnikowia bicuspidata var. bicuspidata NRRL YB-4993]|uniref:DUF3074 domain-containing protein n=1 Tax=Metschnikowia bicuspidata var. bicuspidata NRRL YB-4993 TaxID=869754 RepID=A0A1A0HJF2_9ASCO|nr:hypothetical protein METBIDRAFT_10169 [Metschnikowia bicuspidata var. bicuspidata NRRL YB-4993]OBA23968.1 hypothetical protein METBIDRAFT_10169 [Metschnikowia bicuspidata var. bicuspidata NRRL YB-4993]